MEQKLASSNQIKIISSIILIIGLVLFFWSSIYIFKIFIFIKESKTTTGIIINSQYKGSQGLHSASSTGAWYPEVEFVAETGEKIKFVSNIGNQIQPSYKDEEEVYVYYIFKDPTKAKIKSFSIWYGPFIFLIVGLAFILLGIAIIYSSFIKKFQIFYKPIN